MKKLYEVELNSKGMPNFSTAQEVPQRTGRWIFDENDFLTKCSECGCHPWFGVIPTTKEATKKIATLSVVPCKDGGAR